MKYLLLFLIPHSMYAQVIWSDQSTGVRSIVKGHHGETITVSFAGDPYFGWKSITPVLTRYDKDLRVMQVKDLFTTGENVHFHSARNVKGHVYLFTTWFNSKAKKTILYCTEVDPVTLEVIFQKEINRFDTRRPDIQIKTSRDTSRVLVFANTGKLTVQVLDEAMNKDWGKVITLPDAGRFVTIKSFEVADNGMVYIAYKHYQKKLLRDRMQMRERRGRNFTSKILVCRNDAQELVPDMRGKYVHDMVLHGDDDNNIYLLGLYRDKYRGHVTGHFNIDLLTGSSRFESFPGISADFKIIGTHIRSDGSTDLLAEENYQRVEEDSNCRTVTNYANDILVINYKKNGAIHYTQVPKRQSEEDQTAFISFRWMNKGNNLVLFYNDVAENIRERRIWLRPSVFVMTTVNENGQFNREILYRYKDVEYIPLIAVSRLFDNREMILYAERSRMFKKMYRLGKWEIPHNSPAIQ